MMASARLSDLTKTVLPPVRVFGNRGRWSHRWIDCKSNVLNVLVSLGAEAIDADRVTHANIEPDGPRSRYAEFGPGGRTRRPD
jgi:hypothetical protein